jgi:NAD(P)-dependent dehydrogenase (short-subunit alcohol dehydrogenase family)
LKAALEFAHHRRGERLERCAVGHVEPERDGLELGARKIRANVIAPGAISTDFSGGIVRDNPEINRMVASNTALGRVGLPDDIGAAVAMLLAPESGWINGQRIEVSGGMNL